MGRGEEGIIGLHHKRAEWTTAPRCWWSWLATPNRCHAFSFVTFFSSFTVFSLTADGCLLRLWSNRKWAHKGRKLIILYVAQAGWYQVANQVESSCGWGSGKKHFGKALPRAADQTALGGDISNVQECRILERGNGEQCCVTAGVMSLTWKKCWPGCVRTTVTVTNSHCS